MPQTPSPAAEIAAALASRAEDVCRRYLPQGKKQGRYWVAGDVDGAPGRSLFVRLQPPGVPGKWCDAATGEHGDLLDLIRRRSAASTLRAAMDEARAFLALPAPILPGEGPPYDAREAARRIWRRCRPIEGAPAETYLHARGITRYRFPSLRFHPALFHREADSRLPALVAAGPTRTARSTAYTAPGSIPLRSPRPTSSRPQGAWPGLRTRRALRRPRRYAPGRGGDRDRALARKRRAPDPGGSRSLRRQPRRLHPARGALPPDHRP